MARDSLVMGIWVISRFGLYWSTVGGYSNGWGSKGKGSANQFLIDLMEEIEGKVE